MIKKEIVERDEEKKVKVKIMVEIMAKIKMKKEQDIAEGRRRWSQIIHKLHKTNASILLMHELMLFRVNYALEQEQRKPVLSPKKVADKSTIFRVSWNFRNVQGEAEEAAFRGWA